MAPILGIYASSNYQRVVPDTGAMFPIAMENVGSAGVSSITFSSIPQTYKHLQIRCLVRSNRGISTDTTILRINGDSTSSNYAMHYLYGDGSSAGAFAETSSAPNSFTGIRLATIPASTATAGLFAGQIIDLLDYTSTTKKKVVRALGGYDSNNTSYGEINLGSGVYLANENAVTSITLKPYGGTVFPQYTQIALYGIKG